VLIQFSVDSVQASDSVQVTDSVQCRFSPGHWFSSVSIQSRSLIQFSVDSVQCWFSSVSKQSRSVSIHSR